jgi:hypothetical protein
MHVFYVDEPTQKGARWTWDGNVERPSFSPSMNISSPGVEWGEGDFTPEYRCHYFLRDGVIDFLGDCTHHLRGQKVPLPALPE